MAKRQLENGDSGAAGGCEGLGECDCITGLYPAAKRSRGLAGVCCPSQEPPHAGTERSEAWGKADFQVEDQRPVPGRQGEQLSRRVRLVVSNEPEADERCGKPQQHSQKPQCPQEARWQDTDFTGNVLSLPGNALTEIH